MYCSFFKIQQTQLSKVDVNSETLCFCNYHVSPPREATRREESQSTESWATPYQTHISSN
jgi:hypothetical protein